MFLWFIGGALAVVWQVFHDPDIDYRFVIAGVLAPDIIDLATGRLFVHSIVTSVALLAVVMAVTFGRRPVRRKLIMVPIGMLLHLVLDAAFTRTRVFWWPLAGGALSHGRVPAFDRGVVVPAVLELLGAVLIVLTWRHVQVARGEVDGWFGSPTD